MSKAKERLDPLSEDVDRIQAFIHLQRYKYASREIHGDILDVGCGLGYGSKMLYDDYKSVIAFDISKDAILYAKKKYKGPIYLRADAQTLPFKDEIFDSVVALEIIEHVNSDIQMLKEIFRVLKKNGILILSTPNVAHLQNRIKSLLLMKNLIKKYAHKPKNPYHKREYTPKQIAKLLKSAGFIIEKKWGQILTLPLVNRFPPPLCVNTGRILPDFSLHIIYKARKPKQTSKKKT